MVYYDSEYVRSYAWTQRGSTTETLKLALQEAWREHGERTGKLPTPNVVRRIQQLDISMYTLGNFL